MWQWRRDRKLRRILAELQTALDQVDAFRSGREPESFQVAFGRLWDFVDKYAPRVSEPEVAAALVDATRVVIMLGSAAGSWERVSAAGLILASGLARVALLVEQRDNLRRPPTVYLERLRGICDEALYGMHRAGTPTSVARTAEVITASSYTTRQLMQAATPDQLLAMSKGRKYLLKVLRSLPRAADSGTVSGETLTELESSSWSLMLQNVVAANELPIDEMFLHAYVTGAVTPMAAVYAERDILYLVSGSRGGAAVRFLRDADLAHPPVSVELPGWDITVVRSLRDRADTVFETAASRGRRAVARDLDGVLTRIGDLALAPLLDAWPDLRRVAIVPIGESQALPLSNAHVDGRVWGSVVDTTIAPNAQSLLVAALQQRTPNGQVAVLGDTGHGKTFLPWVAPEVTAVARVHGQGPSYLRESSDDDNKPALRGGTTTRLRTVDKLPSTGVAAETTPNHLIETICSAAIVHLACHGFVPSGGEKLPVLLLGGELNFRELELRQLQVGSTIVLSACSVGGSIREVPLEVLGFPAMLLSVGARSVIASQWPVADDRDTVKFSVSLHEHLLSQKDPSVALASASEEARRAGVPSTVWGGFAVYGT